MKSLIRTSLCLAILAALVIPAASIAQAVNCNFPPEKLILLRHAARQDDSDDSPISVKGWHQAVDLIDQIGNENISSIWVTTKQRTRQTAIPLAEYKSLEPMVVPDDDAGTQQLVTRICRQRTAGVIVYIGHTYTLNKVFESFGLEGDDRFAAANAMEITFSDKKVPIVGPVKVVAPARGRD